MVTKKYKKLYEEPRGSVDGSLTLTFPLLAVLSFDLHNVKEREDQLRLRGRVVLGSAL